MQRSARTLAIGFDAMDPAIARRLIGEGRMPHLAALSTRGAWAPIRLPDGLFVGTVWPVMCTGVDAASTGIHSWIDVDPTTYVLTPMDIRRRKGTAIWEAVGASGRSVVVVDVPHTHAEAPVNGVLVAEWAAHDHHVGFQTHPESLAGEITAELGVHPLLGRYPRTELMMVSPDDHGFRAGPHRTPKEDRALFDAVAPGIRLKTELNRRLLDRYPWDLAVTVYGEPHAVAHQLWHVHDPGHPAHDPAVAADVGSPIERTYEWLDEALGELVDAAGPHTTVVLLLSHGVGPHYDGTHLLEAVLGRLDRWYGAPRPNRSDIRDALGRAGRTIGVAVGPRAGRAIALLLRRRGERPGERVVQPELDAADRATRHFFRSWNNDSVGGVRLNVVGRESCGRIPPEDVDRAVAWLEHQLRAIVDVDTGRPVVRRTIRCSDAFPLATDPTLPDLFVEWWRPKQIESVWSPTAGVVRHSYDLWRTGDHVQHAALVAAGPDIAPGAKPALPLSSVAPSIAARFDVVLAGAASPPVSWLGGTR